MFRYGLLVSMALAAVLAALLSWSNMRNERLRSVVAGHETCLKTVQGRSDRLVHQVCAPAIASAALVSQRSLACDHALEAEELFGLRTSCSGPVKQLLAEREAARGEAANLKQELERERQGVTAAVTRAEARARAEQQRKDHAQALVRAAPRDRDGLSVCDAECLRGRLQAPR